MVVLLTTSVTLVLQDLVFISRRTESGDGDDGGGYDGPSDCVRSNDGRDSCGGLTGGSSGADGVDAGEVVGGADTDGSVSCCGKTVGGSANVTGSDAVCSGKNCPWGTNGFAITKRRMQSSLKL